MIILIRTELQCAGKMPRGLVCLSAGIVEAHGLADRSWDEDKNCVRGPEGSALEGGTVFSV